MAQLARLPLRDMAAGMHHVTATPPSITSSPKRLARASPPAWPGGATTPCGGSIPRWLADSNSVKIARVPYCHALYRGSLTHARGLSTAYGKNGAMSSSVSHTHTTPHLRCTRRMEARTAPEEINHGRIGNIHATVGCALPDAIVPPERRAVPTIPTDVHHCVMLSRQTRSLIASA